MLKKISINTIKVIIQKDTQGNPMIFFPVSDGKTFHITPSELIQLSTTLATIATDSYASESSNPIIYNVN